jgi:hypothetical protein
MRLTLSLLASFTKPTVRQTYSLGSLRSLNLPKQKRNKILGSLCSPHLLSQQRDILLRLASLAVLTKRTVQQKYSLGSLRSLHSRSRQFTKHTPKARFARCIQSNSLGRGGKKYISQLSPEKKYCCEKKNVAARLMCK